MAAMATGWKFASVGFGHFSAAGVKDFRVCFGGIIADWYC
jgi:hypothetical protein